MEVPQATTVVVGPAKKLNEEMYTQSHLLERGWTRPLIKELLGNPDVLRRNPHNRRGNAPPMRLYRKDRVEAAEKTARFREFIENRKPRREAAQRAVQTRIERAVTYAKAHLIVAFPKTEEELLREAAKDYNYNRGLENETYAEFRPFDEEEDPFRDRVCVNYLRHAATNYNSILQTLSARAGIYAARQAMREALADLISEAFPWLTDEAHRQAHDVARAL